MSAIYYAIGQYERALPNSREAVIKRGNIDNYLSLASIYLRLNRPEEARAMLTEVQKRKPESFPESFLLHCYFYQLAFLENDAAGMAQQVASSVGTEWEGTLLAIAADTAAYFGQLQKYRDLTRKAETASHRPYGREQSLEGRCELDVVLAALFGYTNQARSCAERVLEEQEARYGSVPVGFPISLDSSLALAFAGVTTRPGANADDFAKGPGPRDALLHAVWLPTLRAQFLLNGNDPARALEVLKAVEPYELGGSWNGIWELIGIRRLLLYPVYVRANANLAAPHYLEAAADFQAILDHRGIVFNEPIGALAHLGLARSYTLQGDAAKAKAAYQDFLTLWKDADSDIPILKQAKAEYAKLQ